MNTQPSELTDAELDKLADDACRVIRANPDLEAQFRAAFRPPQPFIVLEGRAMFTGNILRDVTVSAPPIRIAEQLVALSRR